MRERGLVVLLGAARERARGARDQRVDDVHGGAAEFGQVGQGLVERAADVLEALDGAHLRVLADVDGRGAGDALVGVER